MFSSDESNFGIPDFEEVERNSKSKTQKNTEKPPSNQIFINNRLIKRIYTRWNHRQLQTIRITTNAPKPRKHTRINPTIKINFHFWQRIQCNGTISNIISMNSYFIVRLKDKNLYRRQIQYNRKRHQNPIRNHKRTTQKIHKNPKIKIQ